MPKWVAPPPRHRLADRFTCSDEDHQKNTKLTEPKKIHVKSARANPL